MQYMALIYDDESAGAACRRTTGTRDGRVHGPLGDADVDQAAATSSSSTRPRRRSASATTRRSSPTAPSPRRRRCSAATTSSRATSIDEACEWAAKIPAARHGAIEVRPVTSTEGEQHEVRSPADEQRRRHRDVGEADAGGGGGARAEEIPKWEALFDELGRTGRLGVGDELDSPSDREDRPRPRRRDARHRRPLRRDEGADRRLHASSTPTTSTRRSRSRATNPGRAPAHPSSCRPVDRAFDGQSSARLPRGMGTCRRDPHPRPRRPRARRGRGAGRVRDRARALAARRARPRTRARGSSPPRATGRSTGSAASRRSRARRSCSARLEALPAEEDDVSSIPDDRLALVFTCCHPALAAEAQVALTLREVGGLDDRRRSRARSSSPSRRWRSGSCARSARSASAGIPFRVPPDHVLPERLARGARRPLPRLQRGLLRDRRRGAVRATLCDEAIRLGEAPRGADARRARGARAARADAPARRAGGDARIGPDGSLVLLDGPGPLALEPRRGSPRAPRVLERALSPPAAGAATSSRPRSRRSTLEEARRTGRRSPRSTASSRASTPSPIVELNRAVAVAMADGPERGLELVERIDLPRVPPAPRRARRPPAPARPARRGRRRLPRARSSSR